MSKELKLKSKNWSRVIQKIAKKNNMTKRIGCAGRIIGYFKKLTLMLVLNRPYLQNPFVNKIFLLKY